MFFTTTFFKYITFFTIVTPFSHPNSRSPSPLSFLPAFRINEVHLTAKWWTHLIASRLWSYTVQQGITMCQLRYPSGSLKSIVVHFLGCWRHSISAWLHQRPGHEWCSIFLCSTEDIQLTGTNRPAAINSATPDASGQLRKPQVLDYVLRTCHILTTIRRRIMRRWCVRHHRRAWTCP